MLFATLLGVVVLKEKMTAPQIVGLLFVSAGLLMLKGQKKHTKKPRADGKSNSEETTDGFRLPSAFYVAIALLSCLLNGLSGMMDKILMKEMTGTQLQFWYMLFLVGFYLIYVIVSRTKLAWGRLLRNYWIWILSAMFVVADRALFEANAISASRITVMTLIKQSGCIITILGGKFVFHEKHIGYRLVCAGVILVGIVIGVM